MVYLIEFVLLFLGGKINLITCLNVWMDGWMDGRYLLRSLSGGLRGSKLGLPEEETGERGRRRRKSRGAHQQRHLTQLRARAHTQAKWARERRRRASQLPVVSFCGLPLGGGEVWCPGSSRILLPTLWNLVFLDFRKGFVQSQTLVCFCWSIQQLVQCCLFFFFFPFRFWRSGFFVFFFFVIFFVSFLIVLYVEELLSVFANFCCVI